MSGPGNRAQPAASARRAWNELGPLEPFELVDSARLGTVPNKRKFDKVGDIPDALRAQNLCPWPVTDRVSCMVPADQSFLVLTEPTERHEITLPEINDRLLPPGASEGVHLAVTHQIGLWSALFDGHTFIDVSISEQLRADIPELTLAGGTVPAGNVPFQYDIDLRSPDGEMALVGEVKRYQPDAPVTLHLRQLVFPALFVAATYPGMRVRPVLLAAAGNPKEGTTTWRVVELSEMTANLEHLHVIRDIEVVAHRP